MKFDMSHSWEPARDKVLEKLAAGAWRHGIKTEEMMAEMIKLGRFPEDLNEPLSPHWRRKYGALCKYGLYYYAQRAGKNVYYVLIGKKTGDPYRVRRFYSVPHGAVEGELDKNGKQKPGEKQGRWLRFEDLTPPDIRWLVKRYKARATDAEDTKKLLWNAREKSQGKPDTITMGEIMDEILEDM